MAEIKSTLDLVMEKTRHMTMSPEERDAQTAEANRKKIAGLVQKYVDGLLRKDQFLEEFEKLNKTESQSNRQLALQEGLDRVELEGTPAAVLDLLASCFRVDVKPLADVLKKYAAQRHALEDARTAAFRQELAADFKISGSAVVPDLHFDAAYVEALSALQDAYSQRVEEEKSRLLS